MTKPFPSGKEMREHWNKQAADYSKFCDDSYSWKYIEMPALAEALADINKESKVAELGCGSGRIIGFLISRGFSPANITGLDISDKFIDLAKKRIPKIDLRVLDFVDDPLPEDSFDLAVSNMVIQNFSAKALEKSLNNINTSLKARGKLLIIAPHPKRIATSLANTKKGNWYVEITPWGTEEPIFSRDKSDYLRELKKAGYGSIILKDLGVIDQGKVDKQQYESYGHTPARVLITAEKI
jgi:SAM-dependent methyltransferase